jgi:hypothetical protein
MRHRLCAALLAALCAALWPLAAQATTYTINLPVQLTNLPFPGGTTVQALCFIFTNPQINQVPGPSQNMQGVQAYTSVTLNAQGSVSTTLKMAITEPSTAPAYKSYTCVLGGYASTGFQINGWQTANQQFEQSCGLNGFAACVSGSLP